MEEDVKNAAEYPDPGTLRLHARVPRSRANVPGLSAVIWLQGCVPGCWEYFNRDTWSRSGGQPEEMKPCSAGCRPFRVSRASPSSCSPVAPGPPSRACPAVRRCSTISTFSWTAPTGHRKETLGVPGPPRPTRRSISSPTATAPTTSSTCRRRGSPSPPMVRWSRQGLEL